MVIAYSKEKQIAILQPQNLGSLFVLHQSGIPLYEHHFAAEMTENQTVLVSGAISAISHLMNEALGVKTSIEAIQFKNHTILLHFKKNDRIEQSKIKICPRGAGRNISKTDKLLGFFLKITARSLDRFRWLLR